MSGDPNGEIRKARYDALYATPSVPGAVVAGSAAKALERLADQAWHTAGNPEGRERVHEDRAIVLAAIAQDADRTSRGGALTEDDPTDAEVPFTNEERDRWRNIVAEQRKDISDLVRQLETCSRRRDYWQTMAEADVAARATRPAPDNQAEGER